MKVTPLDIQQQTFRRRIRGYDFREVEEFLNLLRDEFEGQILENQKLKEELTRLKNLVDEYRSKEEILKSAIITAQKITEDIRANSLKEARIVLSEAELKAEDIIREAQVRLGEILNEIKELKRQKLQFESSVRRIISKVGEIASSREACRMDLNGFLLLNVFPGYDIRRIFKISPENNGLFIRAFNIENTVLMILKMGFH